MPRRTGSTAAQPEHFSSSNTIFLRACRGRPDKTALGDHSAEGYAQRARFYAISPEARLNFAKAVAKYIIFLAENTGLASRARCATAGAQLARYVSIDQMVEDISQPGAQD